MSCDNAADRFADMVRLRLSGQRRIGLECERALLTLAVLDLGLDLADARAILLRLAADAGVLLESRERARVLAALRRRVLRGCVDARAMGEAALLACGWVRAQTPQPPRGRQALDAARRLTVDIAAAEGLTPAWRWWWLGPRRWYVADPARWPDPAGGPRSPVPWQAAR